MSRILGQCLDCGRPILQDISNGAFGWGGCFGGHSWKKSFVSGKLSRVIDKELPGEEPKQIVIPASEFEFVIPEQPEAFRWVYGHV